MPLLLSGAIGASAPAPISSRSADLGAARRTTGRAATATTATVTAIAVAAGLAVAGAARAQTVPDAGSLLRESQQQLPRLPRLPEVVEPQLLRDTGLKVLVKRFEVTGSTRFPSERLQALLADLVGQELGFAQLQAAADRVATLYRSAGAHATALLPEQDLKEGVVRIVVVEGRFGRLKVEAGDAPGRSLPTALIERMLQRGQTRGELLDTAQLERATLIANDLPGVRVSSLLTAGEAPGETDVVVRVDPRPLFAGAATLDNHDVRATGSVKLGAGVSLVGPFGWGDQAQLAGNATQGKQYVRLAYDAPLNASGWRAGVNASAMRYELRGEFAASGGEGKATTWGATSTYPLLRGVASNLYASAAIDRRHLVNDSDAGNLSDKTDTSLALGLNGDATDSLFGGGAVLGAATLVHGRIDLKGNADDYAADQAGPRRHGQFTKLMANLGRLQRLHAKGSVWLSASGQVAGGNLDSGQQFSLGGPNGVRAYPALEGSGDQGLVATVEYRHTVNEALQLNAFYDHGRITREHDPQSAATGVPNSYALKGAGIGVDWVVRDIATVRLIVAQRVGRNPSAGLAGKDSDGTKRTPRVWLALTVPF